ncbi:PIN domain-containing protein [Nitrosomonas ureae]|uniref:DUF4935 domain-containing protein n=1 Tax=Nitrosomonas ureae TaxID=44577 RepID=A0A286A9Z2_9PROT|nr:PIN domain-containing protein [Nitrosomonas ureae]SOD18711.1 hypothetical protein SAMN06297164_1811 [Nitrosomonas ureae]
MYHVVLDTNIYRQNLSRGNLHFKALERLSQGKIVQLYIPYIVMREFQTQQREIYSKDLDKALSGVTGLTRKQLDRALLDKLKDIKEKLESDSESILDGAESQFTDWAKDIGAKIYPLCIDQTNAALEAYFQGRPPLKSVKNRNDIPDSFIVQSINKLRSEVGEIHAIAEDGKVREAFSDVDKITTYGNLSDFIESGMIQNILKDLDLIDNIGPVVDAIEKYENDNSEIMNFIAKNVGDAIVWKTFTDPSIRDDNNEATINSYSEAEGVELCFKNIAILWQWPVRHTFRPQNISIGRLLYFQIRLLLHGS